MSDKFDFRLHDEIGRSSRSQVYKGRRRNTIEYYAVKSVEKKRRDRVSRQVKALHLLYPHPNIVRFVNWYETTRHFWVILEQCVGGNLLQVIKKNGQLPEDSIWAFGKDIVHGLQHIHSRGLIFCDIKPSNILVDENGTLKFGGFGNARRIEDINDKSEDEIGSGTPHYMAPELFIGAPYSTRSDMWSLGCVLYHMGTGWPPYYNRNARDLSDVLKIIMSETPAPLKHTSNDFQSLLGRLLDKNPATRIGWHEFVQHAFWRGEIREVEMPKETLFDEYLEENGLKPDNQQSQNGRDQVDERAKALRETVDVMRFSQIVQSNLESEMNECGTLDAEVTPDNQVQLVDADAEVDFRERPEDSCREDDGGRSGSKENKSPASAANCRHAQGNRHPAQEDAITLPMPPGSATHNSVLNSPLIQRHPYSPMPSAGSTAAAAAAGVVQRTNSISEKRNRKRSSEEGGQQPKPVSQANKDKIRSNNPLALQQPQVQQQQQSSETADSRLPFRNGGQKGEAVANGDKSKSIPRNTRAPSVTDLVFHEVDNIVRPIVANKRIERLPDPVFNQAAIPFEIHSTTALQADNQVAQDAFARNIASTLCGRSNSLQEQHMNVLSYLEYLAPSQKMANKLLASEVGISLLDVLGTSRIPKIQTKALTVLGLLIRHSTFIPDLLAQRSLVDTLVQAVKNEHRMVQARAMACLGELLFYIASQHNHAAPSDVWKVPNVVADEVAKLLDTKSDPIAMHYAVKSLENLATKRSLPWVRKFANEDIVHRLMYIYCHLGTEEHVREAAVSTSIRLLRVNQQLVPDFMVNYGADLVSKGLQDESSRMQIAALNVLNLSLMQRSLQERVVKWLSQNKLVTPWLLKLLNVPSQVLWMKSLAALLLLARYSLQFFMDACQNKFLVSLERLSRDKSKSIHEALALARREIKKRTPELLSEVSVELRAQIEHASTGHHSLELSAAVVRLEVLQNLLISPVLVDRLVTKELIAEVSFILGRVAAVHDTLPGVHDFRNSVLNTIDAICQCSGALCKYNEAAIEHLLPALAKFMESSNAEARFHGLKLVHDILQMFIPVHIIYAAHISPEKRKAEQSGKSREKIDSFVKKNVLPKVPRFLGDVELIPLFTVKILCCLLENNPSYMKDIEELNLLNDLFRILSFENNCNSVHSVKLCRYIVEYTKLPAESLQNIDAVEKVSKFLQDTYSNNVPQFFQPVLELCLALIRAEGEERGFKNRNISHFSKHQGGGSRIPQSPDRVCTGKSAYCAKFLSDLDILMDLLSHTDRAVCLGAAQCFELLAKMLPEDARRMGALSAKNCSILNEFFGSAQENRRPTNAQKQALQAIAHITSAPLPLSGTLMPGAVNSRSMESKSQLAALGRTIGFWKSAESPDVSNLARKVESMLLLSIDVK